MIAIAGVAKQMPVGCEHCRVGGSKSCEVEIKRCEWLIVTVTALVLGEREAVKN